MKSMGDPDYVYRPMSTESKAKLRAAHQKRLGIPAGYCRIYGALIPIADREEVTAIVGAIATKDGREAAEIYAAALAYQHFAGMIETLLAER